MDARQLFLADHSRVHSSAVAAGEGINIEDTVCHGLTDDQLRQHSEGHNSIAWLIWHMARCEDVAVNTIVRGVPDVLKSDNWLDRLGIAVQDVGTGTNDDELADFSNQINLSELRAYRAAVGRETQRWVGDLDFDSLDVIANVAEQLAKAPGAIGERAAWVGDFWKGKTRGWFLSWLAVGHNYYHLGEAEHVARINGRPGL